MFDPSYFKLLFILVSHGCTRKRKRKSFEILSSDLSVFTEYSISFINILIQDMDISLYCVYVILMPEMCSLSVLCR